jgi:glutamine amidotransferase
MIVEVVATGTANTASVLAALARAGVRARVCDDAAAIDRAEAVVLPGVGTLSAAMTSLHRAGIAGVLRRRVEERRALLAICLGMQILCDESEESPGVKGLGALGYRLRRLSRAHRLPHFGWSTVEVDDAVTPTSVLEGGEAYFAHSFGLLEAPAGFRAAWSDCGERFVSAIESGPVVACQFHPELSGCFGRALIGRWLDLARADAARRTPPQGAIT